MTGMSQPEAKEVRIDTPQPLPRPKPNVDTRPPRPRFTLAEAYELVKRRGR
jgi:hypothetical protein